MTVYYRRRPGRLRQVLNLEEFRPPTGYVEPSTCVSDVHWIFLFGGSVSYLTTLSAAEVM